MMDDYGNQHTQNYQPATTPDDVIARVLEAVSLIAQRLEVVETQLAILDDEIAQLARRLKPEDATT